MNTDSPAAGERSESPEPDEPGSSDQPPGRAHTALHLTIDCDDPSLGDDALRWLRAQTPRAAALAVGRAGAHAPGVTAAPHEVRIRIVGDEAMAALHRRHMGEPAPTDVLTFDLREDDSAGAAPSLDVDIVVCVGVARREAAARDISIERELLLYILHGLLHCLGHDDHAPDAHRRMHELEDRILAELGVGATYAPPPEAPAPVESRS